MIRSLARGLDALTLLAEARNGLSVSEIAESLAVDKSTAMRLMKTLVESGFAHQAMKTRRYHMSMSVVGLGYRHLQDLKLRELAHPLLTRLVAETRESAHLAILAGEEALVMEDIVTQESLRVETGIGRFSPLHCTAIGKALLAFSDAPPPSTLTAYTEKTITQYDALQVHLGFVREQGYALDDEEYTLGVRCMAAPVFDRHGLCVAAIGISGPAVRVTHAMVASHSEKVMHMADAMSRALAG